MPFKSVADEMHRFKQGGLHSGSSTGPVVTNRKQAIAIALSEQRKAQGDSPYQPPGKAKKKKGPYDR